MTKGQVILHYRNVSQEERGTVKRWMKANAIGALLISAVVLALTAPAECYSPRAALAQAADSNWSAILPALDSEILSGEEVTRRILLAQSGE